MSGSAPLATIRDLQVQELIDAIDRVISGMRGQGFVPTSEVNDSLLDIRNLAQALAPASP